MTRAKKQDTLSLLVITTSGGGGHLQAANAKIAEERLNNPSVRIATHDVAAQAGSRLMGRFMIHYIWDRSQRKGAVRALEYWTGAIPLFDILFWLPIFIQILKKLWKHDIDHVIDTQPLCFSAITYAVRVYNSLKHKNVFIEKILTELPTGYASYYFSPIKKLSQKNRSLVQLITTEPLLTNHQTAEEFWKEHCGLPLQNISYAEFPIRSSFKKYQTAQKTTTPLTLHITLKTPEEQALIQDLISPILSTAVFDESTLTLTIQPTDTVTTLMLGSQPVQEASLQYVKNFIDAIKNDSNPDIHHYFFVFCAHKALEDTPLQERIHSLVMNCSDYPSNLTIIPMSSQKDDVIAPLYFRSDATLTKSGGITAMELMAVARGKIWIHHEEKTSPLKQLFPNISLFSSYKGMPKWEYGNATYLKEMKGAQMVTPKTFRDISKAYLAKGMN